MSDSSNKFNVRRRPVRGSLADLICFEIKIGQVNDPQVLSADDALNLAAWIVGIADPDRKRFEKLWKEICD